MKRIKVEVLENATIFDAGEQIHRFDLPCSGILAGWAVAAVVDQIKVIADDQWPDIEVDVKGPDRAVEVLTRTLLNKGIAAFDAEEVAESAAPVLRRPTRGRRQAVLPSFTWFHTAVVAVILTVLGCSWWGIEAPKKTQPFAPREATPTSTETAPHTVVVEYDKVRMSVPAGFTLAPRQDGLLVATGRDPSLRIMVAVDPVFGVDAAAIRTEIAAMVATDPDLSDKPNRNLRPGTETVEYLEQPGDGSEVHWVAWVAKDHQFSVGCHTKAGASLSHRATCRQAVETLDLK